MWFVTNGDILMRFPDDIPCFFGVVRLPHEISCLLALVPYKVGPKSSGVGVGGEELMQRHA
jgi:hypothetical protein